MLPLPPRPPAATHAPGPGLDPACRRSHGPQWGPHRARRRPCACAPRNLTCATHLPPARPPTPKCGALRATAGRRPVRPHRPTTATGPAPAWHPLRLGRPPLPMRPAQASTPPPAVPRGLPHTGHRDRHQGTTAGPNTTRHQPYTRYSALVLPPLCPPSRLTDARARPHHRGRGGHTTTRAEVTRRQQKATPGPPLAPDEG